MSFPRVLREILLVSCHVSSICNGLIVRSRASTIMLTLIGFFRALDTVAHSLLYFALGWPEQYVWALATANIVLLLILDIVDDLEEWPPMSWAVLFPHHL